jgi:hypothetical protein
MQEAFNTMKLTPEERGVFEKINTLDQFLAHTMELEGNHRNKKGRDTRDWFQQNMMNFQEFAKTYASIVDAVTVAIPFGVGNFAWGVCATFVTVSETFRGCIITFG